VKRTKAQSRSSEIWRAFAPTTLSSVSVTATLSQSVVSSMMVMSFTGVDTSGTYGSGAIGAVAGGNAASGAPTGTLMTPSYWEEVTSGGGGILRCFSHSRLMFSAAFFAGIWSRSGMKICRPAWGVMRV